MCSTVAASTTETELVAASLASRDVLWVRQLFKELRRELTEPTTMWIDSQGAIRVIEDGKFNARTKHIDIDYVLVRDSQESGDVKASYIRGEKQLADILTKPLPRDRSQSLRNDLGMIDAWGTCSKPADSSGSPAGRSDAVRGEWGER